LSFEIYTDGSFKKGRGSWAYVIVQDGQVLREDSGSERKTSSNFMEFQAAIEALSSLPHGFDGSLFSDSRILIDAMTLPRPQRPLAFAEQFAALDELCQCRTISWLWVKAHAGNIYNERCDELCLLARGM
jgi:ribonuclease HI